MSTSTTSSSSSPLFDLLVRNLGLGKYQLRLSPEEISFLQDFLAHDDALRSELSSIVAEIQMHHSLDFHDIPLLIRTLAELFRTHLIDREIQRVGVVNIVRFVLDSLLESGVIPLPSLEESILRKLIDGSFDLLQYNSQLPPSSRCCSFCNQSSSDGCPFSCPFCVSLPFISSFFTFLHSFFFTTPYSSLSTSDHPQS